MSYSLSTFDEEDINFTPPDNNTKFNIISPGKIYETKSSLEKSPSRNNIMMQAPKIYNYKPKFEDLEVIKELGEGASSSVSLVKDVKSGITYAKKMITLGSDLQPKVIHEEVKALDKCKNNQYIIKMFEAFHRDGKIHILLEYMDGNSLGKKIY
jgi:hypothetical protein